MKNRKWLRWAMVAAAVVALLAGAVDYYEWRENARLDMKSDAVASGFVLADTNWQNPRIEDETKRVRSGKKTRTQTHTYIELTVVVGHCWVELERRIGLFNNNDRVRTAGGRVVEYYALDKVVNFRGAEEVDIDGAPPTPTLLQVIEHLRQNRQTQYCLAA